ncbi:hypothetical protein [Marinicella meishanensis]|uniref:hypothetical protein n=1 Tax=Marinicella meishanensis TaxID=2873263 RepID=UPI001CBEA71F|nr:hypothetical protein [Marinicella sp. NBU2979]
MNQRPSNNQKTRQAWLLFFCCWGLVACQQAPTVVGAWQGQHDGELLTIHINADGSCEATDQKPGKKARDPIHGQWQEQPDGTYQLDLSGKMFSAVLKPDDQLWIKPADDVQVVFHRQQS